MRARIEVEGVADAIRALERYGEAATREASREIVDGALAIQREAKTNAPVDSGRLRNSITAAHVETELRAMSDQATDERPAPARVNIGTLTAVVGTNVEYAEAVHFGSRPHTIEAKEGGVLRWGPPSSPVFATKVQHPGNAPNQFLFRAFESERPKIFDQLKTALVRARREVERG